MSEETVVEFPGQTRLDMPVPKVLATAAGKGLSQAIVIGWDRNGEFYFVSSSPDGPKALWLLENAKVELMNAVRSET